MADLGTGADAVVDEILSYQKVTLIKNHFYANVAPADATDGVIWIDSDDGLVYRRHSASFNQIGGAIEGTAVLSTGETGVSKFLREDGDDSSSWQTVPFKIAQVVTDVYTTQATFTTGFPNDDTLPQRNEGDEIMACTITPQNASSTLIISFTINGDSENNQWPIACLFRSDSMDTLVAMIKDDSWNIAGKTVQWIESAGSTNVRTYSVRVGAITGQNFYTNNYPGAGGDLFSTSKKSVMSVMEILP